MALKLNKKNLAKMNAEQKKEYKKRMEYVAQRREWQKSLKDGTILPGTSWQDFRSGGAAPTPPPAEPKEKEGKKAKLALVDKPVVGAGIGGLGEKLITLGKQLMELDALEKTKLEEVTKVIAATNASFASVKAVQHG